MSRVVTVHAMTRDLTQAMELLTLKSDPTGEMWLWHSPATYVGLNVNGGIWGWVESKMPLTSSKAQSWGEEEMGFEAAYCEAYCSGRQEGLESPQISAGTGAI